MQNGIWIWKYKDFEFYHGMRYLLSREERGKKVPAFYEIPHFSHSARFEKTFNLTKAETIRLYCDGDACLSIDGERQNAAETFLIPAGLHKLSVAVGNPNGMCAIKICGEQIFTDESWLADSQNNRFECAASSALCAMSDSVPSEYRFPEERLMPISDTANGNERIINFGKNTFVRLEITEADTHQPLRVKYGESLEETYSERCVVIDEICGKENFILPERACQYVRFIGNVSFKLSAYYPKLPLNDISFFESTKEMSSVYNISKYTLELCTRMFFLDGIKRDRWPWAGDTYLSAKTNYYSFFDKDTVRRTLILLRGNDYNNNVINNIPGFSMYWFLTLKDYYLHTGDIAFIERNYGSIRLHIEYLLSQCNSEGLFAAEGWNFIDWHDLEDFGYNCCIQMLFGKALEAVAFFAELLEKNDDKEKYSLLYSSLFKKINEIYWDSERGAYVSTYSEGIASKQIRRHQNYFAILFGYADAKKREKILQNVLNNDELPKITTPFFKFFEYEVMFGLGLAKEALQDIQQYWCGIINEGATTVWEEYDSSQSGAEHYAFYGEPFDKSLCHAWGAVPIYFIGKYLAGITPAKAGYSEISIAPITDILDFSIRVPVNNGHIDLTVENGRVTVKPSVGSATLYLKGKEYMLNANEEITVNI